MKGDHKLITLKGIAQRLLVLYIISVYIFSFQTEMVQYSEWVFYVFAGVSFVDILLKRKIQIHRSQYYMLAFLVVCFAGSINAVNTATAISTTISESVLVGISILIFNDFDAKDTRLIIQGLSYAGAILALYTVFNMGFSGYFTAILSGRRLGSVTNAPNILGLYSGLSLLSSVYCVVTEKRIIPRLVYILCLLFAASTLFASGSRGSFLVTGFGFVLLIYLYLRAYGSIGNNIRIIFLSIITLILLANIGLFDTIIDRFSNISSGDRSVNTRLYMLQFGLKQFLNRPLLGHGLNNAKYLLATDFGETYLHNNFIEMLVNTGIFGFILYYSCHFSILRCVRNRARFTNHGAFFDESHLLCIFLLYLLLADISIVFYYNKMTFFIIGASVVSIKSNP